MKKKTILVFIGYYLPGYKSGGPVRTISNMLNLIGNEFHFKIITRDRDWRDERSYEEVNSNEWNNGEKSKIFFSNENTNLRKVINTCKFDTYYLNSLFDFNYSIKIVLLYKFNLIPQKEIILAPRGELMKGALSIKIFKKRLFLFLAKFFNVYSGIIWHASTVDEASEIKREFGENIETRIALDVPDYSLIEQKVETKHKKKKGNLKILFISSIVPKKNLKYAIEILNEVVGNFIFDIYGPIKDEKYWEECLTIINPKIKNRINYRGEINNSDIHNIYPNYDLFFFPTLGENFGHVIWESLSFGCPVLTTKTTPWNRFEEFDAGWNKDLKNSYSIREKIEELIGLNDSKYLLYLNGCTNYIKEFNKSKTLNNNLDLFK